jgi:molybdate transport system substrate-binding protein
MAPTDALLALLLALGATGAMPERAPAAPARPQDEVELVVYAATSTRDVLGALEAAYERDHGVDLVFNFGSSGDLANQIVAAAKADVFLSADEKEMDKVAQAKLVAEGTRRALLSNQLVVIEPADLPSIFASPFAPEQLARTEVKLLSLANVETVPAGRYAKAWLEEVGVWSSVAERILPGVDVRAALAAVESGGAQAGIVYRTDVARSKQARIVFPVPLDEGPRISYPVAAVAGRPQEAAAKELLAFLGSPEARKAFEEAGFIALPAKAGEPR